MAYYQVWLACDGGEDEIQERPDWEALSPQKQETEYYSAAQCIGLAYIGIFVAESPEHALEQAQASVGEDEYLTPGA